MLKSEARILIIREFTVSCVNKVVVIYAVVRGVKGIEHLGLIEGPASTENVLNALGQSSQEVRVVLRYEDALRFASPNRSYAAGGLGNAIRSAVNLLRRLEHEVDRLLCCDNYLNSS